MIHPIHKLNVIIIPKCTALIPKLSTIGKKIGVKIRIAGVGSMKVPNTNKMMFISKRITNGLLDTPKIAVATKLGILVNAKIQDMIEDKPIRNTTIHVSLADSNKILGRSDTLIVQ